MITIDDIFRLERFGLIALKGHSHPSTPRYEKKTMPIPGMTGLWDFGDEVRERTIEIPLGIIEHDPIEKQRKITNFVAFLLDEFGKPRVLKLIFDYETDKYYNVKLASQITPERLIHAGEFVLTFVAYDPYKYANANEYDESYQYDREYLYDIGLMYDNPESFKWEYVRHYSGINNYSSLVADFVIEIQGTVSNGSITNLENNQKLTLPNISNGRLLIDGKRFAIIRNGAAILEGSNYNFFHIQPGEVGFLFEGDNPNATVTYKCLHKFM